MTFGATMHRTRRRLATGVVCAVLAAVSLAGCGTGGAVDPILQLSAQEALERGKELMADEKYARAREFLTHAFEVSPNSVEGREALLLAADSYYLDGGRSNYVQAESKYRDYLNRFPTSDRAAYAQFQIANSLAQRMGRPDRDLTATREALQAYQDLLRLYPTSEYAAQGREKMRVVRENLAEHELIVGQFYLDYRMPRAAAKRFEYLLDNYPAYSEKDQVLYQLGVAHLRSEQHEEAREAFARLSREFPESQYVAEIPDVPEPRPEEDGADEEASDQEASDADREASP